MATDAGLTAIAIAPIPRQRPAGRFFTEAASYWALTKPEINFLIAITTFTGFYLGWPAQGRSFPFLLLTHTLLGTMLVASGAATLNQYLERRFDAEMRRTRRRPLASGSLEPAQVLWFGCVLSFAGGVYLALAVNPLASMFALLTLAAYLGLYTPLKRKTPFCTVAGAFPGAMPPLIGWVAASGTLGFEAWVLYAIVFLWQFPHFMAIAWMYREDYLRAGYLVLPVGVERGRFMSWQALAPALALIPVSLVATASGDASYGYLVAAGALSVGLLFYGSQLALLRSTRAARQLLMASIIYLPLLFFVLTLHKL